MVNTKEIIKSIRFIYNKLLGKNISLLIVGGSLGRGNYVVGWSDVDLLLVLKNPNSDSLKLVKKCERYIQGRFNIEVDTMITTQFAIEHIKPEKLHGKIKNFLFFLPKEKVLIKRNIKLPMMSEKKFGYGFWATYAEQEKNFLRRNADINISSKQALIKLAKKNIKIIFLILKQFLANISKTPSTYKDIIILTNKTLPQHIRVKLQEYDALRATGSLRQMSVRQLHGYIKESVELFYELGKILNK